MKRRFYIVFMLAALLVLTACHSPRREAKRMLARAEALADTLPDSTARLIDSVLRMPVYFSERQRMDMALLQGEALFRDAPLDDDSFEDTAYHIATSPELEHAADHYAKKKQYAKAAHAALYSGYVQQHYNEKEAAMHSFKDAEQYGLLSNDSLTVARAEYRMGKMLYYEGRKQEALSSFNESRNHIGNRIVDLATIQNGMGVAYIMLSQFDSAENCFQQSLLYAEKSRSVIVKHKALNNFAVLYRIQGKNKQAIDYLKQMEESDLTNQEKVFLYLNLGKAYAALGETDSVALYYQSLSTFMNITSVKEETEVAAYEALFHFAESQHDTSALQYYEKLKDAFYEVMNHHQEQAVFRIQKQYDYESLQNAMNQKLMRRHRITIVLGIAALLGLIAFTLSRIRLAKIRKQEAETKVGLLHFMQQNKELLERQKVNEKIRTDLLQQQSEKEIALQELENENDTYKRAYQIYAERYSDAKNKEMETIIRLAVYLKNKGEKAFLDTLKRTVFNAKSPWEAIFLVFDILYPNVRENIAKHYPELTEIEQKDFILSFFKVSRDDEAVMLDTSIHTVDKLRNSVRKKTREASINIKLP